MASYQYSYVIKGLTKTWPGGKTILNDITLSFLPGAKIGVLGPNGAGKSTLLKIIAGVDKEFQGEAWAADGVRIGYLQQEPELDESKTVFENIMEAMGDVKADIDRYNAIGAEFADPDADMDALMAEMGELQAKIDAANGWELERKKIYDSSEHNGKYPDGYMWEEKTEPMFYPDKLIGKIDRMGLIQPGNSDNGLIDDLQYQQDLHD